MIREVLLKIETLHKFVDDCIESGSVSLIDKDIILQNLRDTYILASTMELNIDDDDDFSDNFDDFDENGSENVVIFDANESYAPTETTIEEECAENDEILVEDEITGEEEEKIIESLKEEVEIEVTEEIEEIEEENIVFMAEEEPEEVIEERVDMLGITEELKFKIIAELFDNNEEQYNQFIGKLGEFDDFDDAIIFIYESFPERQGADSIAQLADIISENLNN